MASDVKKKVVKNAGTTPVRTRVYPESARPIPPLAARSSWGSPAPILQSPLIRIMIGVNTKKYDSVAKKNISCIYDSPHLVGPRIKGVPHEKGYIWLTGKTRSLDYLKFTKNAFF